MFAFLSVYPWCLGTFATLYRCCPCTYTFSAPSLLQMGACGTTYCLGDSRARTLFSLLCPLVLSFLFPFFSCVCFCFVRAHSICRFAREYIRCPCWSSCSGVPRRVSSSRGQGRRVLQALAKQTVSCGLNSEQTARRVRNSLGRSFFPPWLITVLL